MLFGGWMKCFNTVVLHLFELVGKQTTYIIGIYTIGAHQFCRLPNILPSHNRGSYSNN